MSRDGTRPTVFLADHALPTIFKRNGRAIDGWDIRQACDADRLHTHPGGAQRREALLAFPPWVRNESDYETRRRGGWRP